jgi:hypothetical protein
LSDRVRHPIEMIDAWNASRRNRTAVWKQRFRATIRSRFRTRKNSGCEPLKLCAGSISASNSRRTQETQVPFAFGCSASLIGLKLPYVQERWTQIKDRSKGQIKLQRHARAIPKATRLRFCATMMLSGSTGTGRSPKDGQFGSLRGDELRGARMGTIPRLLSQRPGKGDLSRSGLVLLRALAKQINRGLN